MLSHAFGSETTPLRYIIKMNLISYCDDSGNSPKEIHTDDGMVLIVGYYNHKNQHAKGEKALGVHWGDYPQSRGVLSTCVIPTSS